MSRVSHSLVTNPPDFHAVLRKENCANTAPARAATSPSSGAPAGSACPWSQPRLCKRVSQLRGARDSTEVSSCQVSLLPDPSSPAQASQSTGNRHGQDKTLAQGSHTLGGAGTSTTHCQRKLPALLTSLTNMESGPMGLKPHLCDDQDGASAGERLAGRHMQKRVTLRALGTTRAPRLLQRLLKGLLKATALLSIMRSL